MSSDDRPLADGTPDDNAAINVEFSSIADKDGEPSSRAGSRSSGQRSQGSHREHVHSKKEDKTSRLSMDGRSDQGSSGAREGSGHRIRRSGGFLLDSVFSNGSPPGPSDLRSKRKAQDRPLHIERRRPVSNRISGESSMRSSPLSNELTMDGTADAEEGRQRQTSRQQAMDPAQLVQMALNLSESRKRHVSNTLQVPLQPGRRVSSSYYGTVRTASSGSKRASQVSDSYGRRTPSSDHSGSRGDGASLVDYGPDNVLHTFSPATLARAEKARKYFELASEHRRLLEHLPPLKPNADATGNYTFASKSSPGSAFPEITRISTNNDEKHELGRPYNPIQSLRNRRVRIRERRPFTAPPETWSDPEKVKQWIDDVEGATENENYRAKGDQVELPRYPDEDESLGTVQPGARGHRRNDTAGSVITRPENSWTIEPTELLADVYWTEKGDNKYYIETRRGNPIFPQPPRRSIDTPKISIEMHRDRNDEDADDATGSDTDEGPKRNRRRKLTLPLNRATKPEKRKHRRILSRTSSESSDDSFASAKARRLREGRSTMDNDIAPLERHMQSLIEKDARGELSPQEIVSPDHWDTKHSRLAKERPSLGRVQRTSMDKPNGRGSLEVPRHDHRRSKSADGRMGSLDKEMSSASTLDSEPTTPVGYGSSPGLDFSPPYNKRQSQDDAQGSKLPVFRSQSKERRGIEQTDFAESTSSNLYTIMSADSNRPRSSMESGRPHIFSRHRTNDSIDKSLPRTDTDSTVASNKEGGSTVGRFLKGRRDRIGGLVSERFRTRDRAETLGTYDTARAGISDISDMEDGRSVNGQLKKRMTEPRSAEISPRGSVERGRPKPKFHLSGLPSFTSSAARDKRLQGDAADEPITRQQKEQRDTGRSERFDRLAPPKINVATAPDSEAEPKPSRIKWAKGYGDLSDSRATSASRGSVVPASGPGSAMRQRQRHWSIYDQVQPEHTSSQISNRDIARVRALLLASGIKAREIHRRADESRDEAPTFLLDAAKVSNSEDSLRTLPAMKDEHLLASRLLSAYLSNAASRLEGSITHFQTHTAKDLNASTSALHSRAADHLTKLVHETSDAADAFVVELTTRGPQNTKQVLDAVDEMVRRRRRQWRLLVNVAFKVLEWVTLGVMWGIWAVVVVVNGVRRGVTGVGRLVRWLVVF